MSLKAGRIVEFVIEAYHACNTCIMEIIDEVFRAPVVFHSQISSVGDVLRWRESNNFVWDNPAQVTMFQHLLELIAVKASLAIPVKLDRALNTIQTVDNGQWEVFRTDTRIPERAQFIQVCCAKNILYLFDRPSFCHYKITAN